jgi:hypothetical protein
VGWASPGSFVNVALAPTQPCSDSLAPFPVLPRLSANARDAGGHHRAAPDAARDLPVAARIIEVPADRQLVPDQAASDESVAVSRGGQPQLVQHAPTDDSNDPEPIEVG